MRFERYIRNARQWLLKTPERALDQAYTAAQRIKAIEAQYFNGQRIAAINGNFGQSSQTYFDNELKKYLKEIKTRLAEFHTSRSVIPDPKRRVTEVQVADRPADWYTVDVIDQPATVLRKLQFVDEVLARYKNPLPRTPPLSPPPSPPPAIPGNARPAIGSAGLFSDRTSLPGDRPSTSKPPTSTKPDGSKADGLSDSASFLPRSILRTVDRIKQELNPESEVEVMQSFRSSRVKTLTSLKFILLLIIVPLLVQQVAKNFIGPVVDQAYDYAVEQQWVENAPFLNLEIEEEALHELQRYEERLRFEALIGKTDPLSEPEIEAAVRHKATEIEHEFMDRSTDALKNVVADIVATFAFAAVLVNSRREIATLKSFIDEIVYGLSDSAKAFIIILFTDMFVGFHSPHGWEVLLEGISRHFGLPANRDFIFLFIATFPVILDTVFKYWIFRYLNRISPSAVATYKNMNE